MAWETYNASERHPFEATTGSEGRCMHCGLRLTDATRELHSRPYEPPLPSESKIDNALGQPRPLDPVPPGPTITLAL